MIVSHFWIWCFPPPAPIITLCLEGEEEGEEEGEVTAGAKSEGMEESTLIKNDVFGVRDIKR